jgi:DNA-binding MarR family transcriptional regulator
MIMKETQTTNMKGYNVDSLLSYVLKLWVKDRRQLLDEFGLTIPQYEVLNAISSLSNYKKDIIQTDLSKETRIEPMNISMILRNLEKNNLITRRRGTMDTRVMYIGLTEKGKSVYQKASSGMLSSYSELYSNIDEKDLTIQLLKLSNVLSSESRRPLEANYHLNK